MSLGLFVILAETTKLGAGLKGPDVLNSLASFVLAFGIFNTYMLRTAWYASAAGVINGMSPRRHVLPVG